MSKSKRNIVFKVGSTRTFKSEDPHPGKETWDSVDFTVVLAADAEDAISRVRAYWDRDDKFDGTIKRRTAFVFDSVTQVEAVDIL